MMYHASLFSHELVFYKPARTSRNSLLTKQMYLLRLSRRGHPSVSGIGEISLFEGLSTDDSPGFLPKLQEVVARISDGEDPEAMQLTDFPSIRFGLETALLDLKNGGIRKIFPGDFYEENQEIPINGLIWMESPENMWRQVEEKAAQGFRCIKMKIGAGDFDEECRFLEKIRKKYSAFSVELRVDANGAFPEADALKMLKELHRFELHSIEQPIRQGQWEAMEELCARSPLPVALDEELLGLNPDMSGELLLKKIRPAYCIIKPGLLGGFKASKKWISLCRACNTGWWITSALESNIGLNAIAQFAASYRPLMPQGLGTGLLFTNNIPSPLYLQGDKLLYGKNARWLLPEYLL
jgi:O-succinylbenzoate synthase